jgi:hypothetical protein
MVARQTSEPLDDLAKAEQQRTQAEVQARKRSAASRCDYAVYGLDATWSGRRWFGGWGESDGELSSVELAHGDAFDEVEPLLRVRTEPVMLSQRQRRDFRPEHARLLKVRHTAHALAQYLWHVGADHSAALQATCTADDPTEHWSPLPLLVDGETVPFRSLAGWTS